MDTNENDVIEMVLAQHRDVAARLSAVLGATGAERTEEFDSLAALLPLHEAAEEAVIYPMLRTIGANATKIVTDRVKEETAASTVLAELKGLDTSSAKFETMFTAFAAKVHEHAASEEADVLPLLKEATNAEQRRKMGEAFLAEQKDVPSHR